MCVTVPILLAITLIVTVVKFLKWYIVELPLLPPGPLPLPLIGNRMPNFVHPDLCCWHAKLRGKYGNVFTLHQGSRPTIIVNGYKAIVELLSKNGHLVSKRPQGLGFLRLLHEDSGLVWNNLSYKQLRRITAEAIKSYVGQQETKRLVIDGKDKLEEMLMKFEQLEGKPADISESLRDLVLYNTCALLFGNQGMISTEKRFRRAITLHYACLGQSSRYNFLHRIPLLNRFSTLKSTKEQFDEFLEEELVFHKNQVLTGGVNPDFFHMFIKHSDKGKLSDVDCKATIMQLFLAGLDSVHGVLMWFFLFCATNIEMQQKMACEISNLGDSWRPLTNDMKTTPYCTAVINEVLRISNVAFTTLPYINDEDITIEGQNIPKKSTILVNLTSIHKDPELFENPDVFNPERFFDEQGQLKKIDHFMPFSTGRRSCIGEKFSRISIFSIIAAVISRFEIKQVDGEGYSTQPQKAFLSVPQPYQIRLVSRR